MVGLGLIGLVEYLFRVGLGLVQVWFRGLFKVGLGFHLGLIEGYLVYGLFRGGYVGSV